MRSIANLMGSIWDLVKAVAQAFMEDDCPLRAAALAYYGLFSIFPLLLFLLYLGTNFLASETARAAIDAFLEETIPVSPENIDFIINQTLRARGSIGVVGAVGLIWSGSAVFAVLESALSVIWGGAPRPFWSRRLLAAAAVLALSILFVAFITLGPIISWTLPGNAALLQEVLNLGVGLLLISLTAALLYRIFPNRDVSWPAAIIGALVAGILIQVARFFFDLYLSVSFRNFGFIYGSLAWIVALALWTYLVSVLFFIGAEVGATLEERHSQNQKPSEALSKT